MAIALAVALFASAAPATAQDGRLPENNSGTEQYVEPVPDAGGDRPASPGADGGSGNNTLPPDRQADLPPGQEGRILERLATDPGSGAPADGAGGNGSSGGSGGSGAGGGSASEDDPSAVDAVTSAAVGDDGPGVPLLVLGILALTLGVAVAGRVRSRRT